MKKVKTILIVLDTLRRNHLSCCGYERKTSPNIDKLAKDGVLFNNEYTCDVPTIPSFTAMLNGQIGLKTGIVSFNPTERLFDSDQSLPYILAKNGIVTAAVSTLFYMRSWFARGFQNYLNPLAGARERTQTVDAEEINSAAIPWLKQNCDKSFFLFVHYWDPHCESTWNAPMPECRYKAPERFKELYYKGQPKDLDREYVISQYDANVTYADEEIGKFLYTIDDLGITDETLVIFTTDHGENLGDDHPTGKNLWDHYDIYEDIVHTPLMMRYPEVFPKKKQIDTFVQNIDLSPTILDMYGIPAPNDFDGKSLLPIIRGETLEGYQEVYVSTGFATCKRAIITCDKMKLIRTYKARPDSPSRELFDLEKDEREQHNLVDERKDIADQLETRMLRWAESMLGDKPDPLKIRATMGMIGSINKPAVYYYSIIYPPRTPEKGFNTATP